MILERFNLNLRHLLLILAFDRTSLRSAKT